MVESYISVSNSYNPSNPEKDLYNLTNETIHPVHLLQDRPKPSFQKKVNLLALPCLYTNLVDQFY